MAREEQDREDLMRDATALIERVELALPGRAENLVAGFRRGGAVSLYLGQDPVYHFNAAGQLRRAFVAGLLVRADDGRLASLRRERTKKNISLVRHELSPVETEAFRASFNAMRQEILALLDGGRFKIVAQVPLRQDVLARFRTWLAGLPECVEIARSPRVA